MGNGIFFLPVLDKTEFNGSLYIPPFSVFEQKEISYRQFRSFGDCTSQPVNWVCPGGQEAEERMRKEKNGKEQMISEEGKARKEHKEEKALRMLLLYFMRASWLLLVLSIYWDKNLFLPLPMCLTLKRLSNGIWLCVWRSMLGVELRTSQVLRKCSLTELQPWSFLPMK